MPIVEDPLLPAAQHLVGTDATDLLAAAVASYGGALHRAVAVQVQHRPGHDLVVRFEAEVAWDNRAPRRETLLAAATHQGAPEGTLLLTADGGLEAGVWRYPFDPRLPGLGMAVTPGSVDRLLASHLGPRPDLEVVAYRPIRRAVVRATNGDRTVYLKVVRPSETAAIVHRHEALQAAGLPVPAVLDADEANGLLVLDALPGDNLRDRLLDGTRGWPRASAYVDLMQRLAAVSLPPSLASPTSRLTPAAIATGHARALVAILPREAERLARITDAVAGLSSPDDAPTSTIHGDLYEAQLMVDADGALTGLLDLDDVAPGDPLADAATTLAHLHILEPDGRRHRDHLRRYRTRLRHHVAAAFCSDGDATMLDRRTAGVLVGLATGPFRAQRARWQAEVRRRISMADRLVARSATEREKTLRSAS